MNRRRLLSALGMATGFLAGPTEAADAEKDQDHEKTPVDRFHLYLCAFHVAKRSPNFQVEAHHYCSQVADEVHQCVIFDSTGINARILGIEYIISDRLYRALPDAEKKYYHPHSYEVLSGLLVAPGMEENAEHELMGKLVTTWGKTWHTWPDPKSDLPLGEPLLMWSNTGDGQLDPKLLAERDRKLRMSTTATRRRRADLGPVPQISPPRSWDEIGRQWTNEGPDERPRKR